MLRAAVRGTRRAAAMQLGSMWAWVWTLSQLIASGIAWAASRCTALATRARNTAAISVSWQQKSPRPELNSERMNGRGAASEALCASASPKAVALGVRAAG